MMNYWGCPGYVDEELNGQVGDAASYRGAPHAIVVNRNGRRIGNESSPYSVFNLCLLGYENMNFRPSNNPSYTIWDQTHVDYYGWPDYGDEQPSWVKSFDTIEELAEACGIDAAALSETVERFNGYCETGVDEEFNRGTWEYDLIMGGGQWKAPLETELPNPCLGKIETAPFYVAELRTGTIGGTAGGVRINADAQAIDIDGNPIEGLYACGNDSEGYCGSGYSGGMTVSAGWYYAMRAANHAMGLGILE